MAKITKPKLEMWPVSKLKPYAANAKIHTESQVEALAKVITTQGWDVPIVVDADGVIIKGHGRRLAAIHLGLAEVPVICRADLTPAQVKAARLSDNRVALTDFDTTLIKDELTALNLEGFDMGSMGFDTKELDMLIKSIDTIDVDAFEDTAGDAGKDSSSGEGPADPGEKPKPPIEFKAVLGFASIPAEYERDLVKFLSYAESMTGKRGMLAFGEFVKSVVTEIEARA